MATLKSRLFRLEQRLASKPRLIAAGWNRDTDYGDIIRGIEAAQAAGTLTVYSDAEVEAQIAELSASITSRRN